MSPLESAPVEEDQKEQTELAQGLSRTMRWKLKKGGEAVGALLRQGNKEWGCRDDGAILNEGGSQMICYYLDRVERGIAEGDSYIILEYLRWLSQGYVLDRDGQPHFLLSRELSFLAETALDYLRQVDFTLDEEKAFTILNQHAIDTESEDASSVVQEVEARVAERLDTPSSVERITRGMIGGLIAVPSSVVKVVQALRDRVFLPSFGHKKLTPSPVT